MISLLWRVPLACVVFIYSFLAQQPRALRMAWLNSFVYIEVDGKNDKAIIYILVFVWLIFCFCSGFLIMSVLQS